MYVVIFRATVAVADEEYSATANILRELALGQFGCLEFVSMMDGNKELALSWWPDEHSIQKWKTEADHLMAQKLGRERWYQDYQVDVALVKRRYCHPT